MGPSSRRCQYYYPDLVKATSPDTRSALPLRKYGWALKRDVWYISVLGWYGFLLKILPSAKLGRIALVKKRRVNRSFQGSQDLNLQPGEWIEVRSAKEIFSTLDERGKLRGLTFTREMARFCGNRYRVYKRLNKIIVEATGELRTIKSPTVLLEGVFCDGKSHGDCDRSCFCFWREAWLKRSSSKPD